MAFSMFLRNSVCANRVFSQQVMRLATQPALAGSRLQTVPVRSLLPKEINSTSPIINAVRTFRTSVVRLAGAKSTDHSKLWVIERAVSAALIPLIPLSLMFPNKLFDSVLAILLVAHIFWGFEAIAVDYVRAILFGPVVPKIAIGLVYAICIATLGGLFYIISHDIGIGESIKRFWAIKANQKS